LKKRECKRSGSHTPYAIKELIKAHKMTQLKNSFSDDLEQIRARQVAVLEDIDAIRERSAELPKDTEDILDKIQKDALSAIHEIEQIKKQNSGGQS
jgi:hypothetical protein